MDDHLTNSSPEENSVCLISCVISWSVKVQAGVLIEVAHGCSGHFRGWIEHRPLHTLTKQLVFFLASFQLAAATAAKSLQSCPTLCDPTDGSPPGSPVPGILQARTLEWVAISFSNA